MKKLLLFFLLVFIPLSSAISTNMLPVYQPGETMIVEVQGNILSPIDRSDVVFRRAHVAIAVDYDIKRVLDKYYLYAQVPLNPNNYTLFINGISTTLNGQNQMVDFNQTFEVSGNLTDYSINPGLIITNQDFSLTIKSNLDQQTTISSDFPEEMSLTINPGNNPLNFDVSSKSSGFYLATIGKYKVPIQVIKSESSQSDFSISVFPKFVKEVLKLNSLKSYNFSILNNGNQSLTDLYFAYNQEIFSLDKESFSLSVNESINLSVTLKNSSQNFNEIISIASGNDMVANITFQISFTQNDSQVTNSSNPEYYCSELGGSFCSATEVCSGQSIQSLDGLCCVGSCSLEEKSSTNWIIYILAILVLVVIIFIYLRYKKAKLPKPKNLAINSVLKRPV